MFATSNVLKTTWIVKELGFTKKQDVQSNPKNLKLSTMNAQDSLATLLSDTCLFYIFIEVEIANWHSKNITTTFI